LLHLPFFHNLAAFFPGAPAARPADPDEEIDSDDEGEEEEGDTAPSTNRNSPGRADGRGQDHRARVGPSYRKNLGHTVASGPAPVL